MTDLIKMMKAGLAISALVFSGSIFADNNAEPLQLAQLTDGFDAQQAYMASCFACHHPFFRVLYGTCDLKLPIQGFTKQHFIIQGQLPPFIHFPRKENEHWLLVILLKCLANRVPVI